MPHVVMLFSHTFEPHQGRYHRVYNEAQALIARGYRVTILAWDRRLNCPRIETVDGINVRRLRLRAGDRTGPRLLPRLFLYWLWIIGHLSRNRCDVLHLHNVDVLPVGVLIKHLRGPRVILDVCEPDYYAMWPERLQPLVNLIASLERQLARQVDYVLVHNRYQVQKYTRWGIGNLEQVGSYPTLAMVRASPKPLKEKSEPVVLGTVGTFFHNSGVEETIAAFSQLAGGNDRVRLLLAGRVPDYYRRRFDELTRPFGDRMITTGPFDAARIPEMYDRIDVSLMVCERDRWYRNITPTKFFDSLANGVPIIASDIGGLGELIADIGCGCVVDETDIDAVASAMQFLIDHPEERCAMGRRALKAAQEEFNFERMAERLTRVYDRLLAGKRCRCRTTVPAAIDRCRRRSLYAVVKRCLDVAGAVIGLALTSPLIGVIAALIRCDSSGPALFLHERVGRDGQRFMMYKFRTMRDGAHEVSRTLAKRKNDPRLTRVGRILRRWSLDELPQFFNVLKGDMSLVGPRPLPAFQVDFCDPRTARRLSVPPGLTGLWQISGRADIEFKHWIDIDIDYIAHQSFMLDGWILLRTIPAVLSGRGAY